MRDSTRARLHGIKLAFKNLWREVRGRSTEAESSTMVYVASPAPVLVPTPVVYDSTYLLRQQMAHSAIQPSAINPQPQVVNPLPVVEPSVIEPQVVQEADPSAISEEMSAVEMQNPQVIESQRMQGQVPQELSTIGLQPWNNFDPSAVSAQNRVTELPPRSTIVDLHRPPAIDPVLPQVSTMTWHSSAEIPPAPVVPPYQQMPPAPVIGQPAPVVGQPIPPAPVLGGVQPAVADDPVAIASLPEMSGVALPRTANQRLFDRLPPVGPASPPVDPAAVSEQRFSWR